MFCFVLLAVASILSAPNEKETAPPRKQPALIHEDVRDEFGQYALRFVTAEGTIVSERGRLIPTPDGKGHVMVVDGEVTYMRDDGKPYMTKYSAGLDGYKAVGDHLPVAPTAVPPVSTSV